MKAGKYVNILAVERQHLPFTIIVFYKGDIENIYNKKLTTQ